MSESTPETPEPVETPEPSEPVDPALAVEVLASRRAVLTGGEDSIGIREQRVEQMQAALAKEEAALAACRIELASIDAAIALLTPAPSIPEEV